MEQSITNEAFLEYLPKVLFKEVQFIDIVPLLANHDMFSKSIECLSNPFKDHNISHVVGLEARGFIFGAPVAQALGCGFVPLRKPNKLPGKLLKVSYKKEYGQDEIALSEGILNPQSNVLIIDDVLATGGTMVAAHKLINQVTENIEAATFIEIEDLPGRKACMRCGFDVLSILKL